LEKKSRFDGYNGRDVTKHKSINALDITLEKRWVKNVSYNCSHGVHEPLRYTCPYHGKHEFGSSCDVVLGTTVVKMRTTAI
jgi:hypothetical protein